MLSQIQIYKLTTELHEYFDQLVTENRPFPVRVYQTRSKSALSTPSVETANMKASCSSMSEIEVDDDSVASSKMHIPPPSRTSRRLRAKRGRSTDSEVDGDQSQDFSKNPSPVRKTRRRSKAAADKYGGYGLRTRNGLQQDSFSSKSNSTEENSDEEESVGSRQSEEEEAYLDDLESEESPASVMSGSKRVRRSMRQTRKKAKIQVDSDSDEETMTTISMSRSGRIVKPTIKFS